MLTPIHKQHPPLYGIPFHLEIASFPQRPCARPKYKWRLTVGKPQVVGICTHFLLPVALPTCSLEGGRDPHDHPQLSPPASGRRGEERRSKGREGYHKESLPYTCLSHMFMRLGGEFHFMDPETEALGR